MYFGTSKVTFKTLFTLFDLCLRGPVVSTGSTTAERVLVTVHVLSGGAELIVEVGAEAAD